MPGVRAGFSLNLADAREVVAFLQASYRTGMRPTRGVATLHKSLSATIARSTVAEADVTRRRMFTLEQKRRARCLRAEGYLIREIAKEMGCSKSIVQRWLCMAQSKEK